MTKTMFSFQYGARPSSIKLYFIAMVINNSYLYTPCDWRGKWPPLLSAPWVQHRLISVVAKSASVLFTFMNCCSNHLYSYAYVAHVRYDTCNLPLLYSLSLCIFYVSYIFCAFFSYCCLSVFLVVLYGLAVKCCLNFIWMMMLISYMIGTLTAVMTANVDLVYNV